MLITNCKLQITLQICCLVTQLSGLYYKRKSPHSSKITSIYDTKKDTAVQKDDNSFTSMDSVSSVLIKLEL